MFLMDFVSAPFLTVKYVVAQSAINVELDLIWILQGKAVLWNVLIIVGHVTLHLFALVVLLDTNTTLKQANVFLSAHQLIAIASHAQQQLSVKDAISIIH